jgi:hypothetical protein
MDLTIGPSPSDQIAVSRYDSAVFPNFRIIFEVARDEGALHLLAQPAEEADTAVVMENCGDRDVTALQYAWVMTDEEGKVKTHRVSFDGYGGNFYHPVLTAKKRRLITRLGAVDEGMIDHVLRGGGVIAGHVGDRYPIDNVTALRFDVDMLLFADGEIAGLDTGRFAAELRCRERAAAYVARHIRLADTEGRDPTPVLAALAEIPLVGNPGHAPRDPLVNWVRRYAQEYLRAMCHKIDGMREGILSRLESHPPLPKFYRREDGIY